MNMSKVSARWVPQLLTTVHRQARIELCNHFISMFDRDPEQFISRMVTGDETWLYGYDPATKQMSMEWRVKGASSPVKPLMQKSISTKVMALVFYDGQGVIHGETVTTARYITALSNLRQGLRHWRRGKLIRGILFHHDNAPAHRCLNVSQPFLNMGSKSYLTLRTARIYPRAISIFSPKSNDSWKVGDSRTLVSWNKLLKMLSPKSRQISLKEHFKRSAIEQRSAW